MTPLEAFATKLRDEVRYESEIWRVNEITDNPEGVWFGLTRMGDRRVLIPAWKCERVAPLSPEHLAQWNERLAG